MTTTTTESSSCLVEYLDGGGFELTLYARPVPASRPRVTRWGTYYGKTYAAWMKLADKYIPEADRQLDELVTANVLFVCHRPPTTKRITPNGDIDNHLKSILDALTKKGYWRDDMDITHLTATKRFTAPGEVPHTFVHAYGHTS